MVTHFQNCADDRASSVRSELCRALSGECKVALQTATSDATGAIAFPRGPPVPYGSSHHLRKSWRNNAVFPVHFFLKTFLQTWTGNSVSSAYEWIVATRFSWTSSSGELIQLPQASLAWPYRDVCKRRYHWIGLFCLRASTSKATQSRPTLRGSCSEIDAG